MSVKKQLFELPRDTIGVNKKKKLAPLFHLIRSKTTRTRFTLQHILTSSFDWFEWAVLYDWLGVITLVLSLKAAAPSWCRRHRKRHNRTPPHEPIVFYCFLRSFVLLFPIILHRMCLLHLIGAKTALTPNKEVIIKRKKQTCYPLRNTKSDYTNHKLKISLPLFSRLTVHSWILNLFYGYNRASI